MVVIVKTDLKETAKKPNVFVTDINSFLHIFIDAQGLAKMVKTRVADAVRAWNDLNSSADKVDHRLPVDRVLLLDARELGWTRAINHTLVMIISTFNHTKNVQSVNTDVFCNEEVVDVTLRYRCVCLSLSLSPHPTP